jgi:hypothetical protein
VTQDDQTVIWVHPGIAVESSPIEGKGLFAADDMGPGTILIRLTGRLVDTRELGELIRAVRADPSLPYVDTLTVNEDEHLVLPPGSIVHFGNHSCDPNMWHDGAFVITARKHISSGEELTIDYGTQSGAPGFSMPCHCGSPKCRKLVTSEDWRIPELQVRYRGHWVPALAERITQG